MGAPATKLARDYSSTEFKGLRSKEHGVMMNWVDPAHGTTRDDSG